MQGRWDAWILSAFGACAVPGLIALELHAHLIFPGTLDQLLRVAGSIFIFGAAIFGTLLATYTGVLIGATAIPAWFLHRTPLPIHFETTCTGQFLILKNEGLDREGVLARDGAGDPIVILLVLAAHMARGCQEIHRLHEQKQSDSNSQCRPRQRN
jgi:hypothetical protein